MQTNPEYCTFPVFAAQGTPYEETFIIDGDWTDPDYQFIVMLPDGVTVIKYGNVTAEAVDIAEEDEDAHFITNVVVAMEAADTAGLFVRQYIYALYMVSESVPRIVSRDTFTVLPGLPYPTPDGE